MPNDILDTNGYISSDNLKTQDTVDKISQWTTSKKMKLNIKKSSLMCFNFTRNYQFTTRVKVEGQTLPILEKTKLLGVIVTNDIKWSENTKSIIKRANSRMDILRKLVPFGPPLEDMKLIYISYIRSVLEQSCTIWHSSLIEEDRISLERVQKNAFRNILQDKYISYENALVILGMETLHERREKLLLKFGLKCTQVKETKDLFPLKKTQCILKTRHPEKYEVYKSHTERMKLSTVPYLQRMLNDFEKKKSEKRTPGHR